MEPMIDPRRGDVDDDASSTKSRSLFALTGTLLAEISFSKVIFAWILLVGLPALLLGAAPLLITIWLTSVSSAVYSLLTGLLPVVLLAFLIGRRLVRAAAATDGGRQFLVAERDGGPAALRAREGKGCAISWRPRCRRV